MEEIQGKRRGQVNTGTTSMVQSHRGWALDPAWWARTGNRKALWRKQKMGIKGSVSQPGRFARTYG